MARPLILFVIFVVPTLAKPVQLIESESALLIRKGYGEIKSDIKYETGFLPAALWFTQLRYGLFKAFEIAANVTLAHFVYQDKSRLANFEIKPKVRLVRNLYRFQIFLYGRYRESPGAQLTATVENRRPIVAVISPHADGGRDFSLGLASRSSFLISKRRLTYLLGLEGTFLTNREPVYFGKNQKMRLTFLFAPELHFVNNRLMLAIENRIHAWLNRGYFYEILPQARWQLARARVLEAGVMIPIIGAKNYRFMAGFTYITNF